MRLERLAYVLLVAALPWTGRSCTDNADSTWGILNVCTVWLSSGLQCDDAFCPTCEQNGVCDKTCGYCGPTTAPSGTPSFRPTFSMAPTLAPTPFPSSPFPTTVGGGHAQAKSHAHAQTPVPTFASYEMKVEHGMTLNVLFACFVGSIFIVGALVHYARHRTEYFEIAKKVGWARGGADIVLDLDGFPQW